MLRLSLSLLVLTSGLAGAAPDEVVPVRFKMATLGASKQTLLQGQLGMPLNRSAELIHKGDRDAQHIEIALMSSSDDTIAVRVKWRERTSTGEELEWTPSVSVKRGSTTDVEVTMELPGGGGRTLLLTVG